jgi:predicted DNA-binding mobile mystery protein A
MKNQMLTVRQIDRQLKEWQMLNNMHGSPKPGWVKTIRVALNMSVAQLAKRLGLSRGRITQLENAEIEDAVTLRALKEVANAMECELVYAIVPKNGLTLEDIIKARANQIANEKISRVAHSMSLEEQALDNEAIRNQKDELVKSLIEHLNKKLWAEQDSLQEKKQKSDLLNKLIKNLQKKK